MYNNTYLASSMITKRDFFRRVTTTLCENIDDLDYLDSINRFIEWKIKFVLDREEYQLFSEDILHIRKFCCAYYFDSLAKGILKANGIDNDVDDDLYIKLSKKLCKYLKNKIRNRTMSIFIIESYDVDIFETIISRFLLKNNNTTNPYYEKDYYDSGEQKTNMIECFNEISRVLCELAGTDTDHVPYLSSILESNIVRIVNTHNYPAFVKKVMDIYNIIADNDNILEEYYQNNYPELTIADLVEETNTLRINLVYAYFSPISSYINNTISENITVSSVIEYSMRCLTNNRYLYLKDIQKYFIKHNIMN